MQALQLDPLNIVARSQEIALYGRVLNFNLAHLYQAAYEQRRLRAQARKMLKSTLE